MPLARKGRKGRLTIILPSLEEYNVKVRQKGKSDEVPEMNITTTESPLGEAEYDDEGGLPNRELTFTELAYEGQAQRFYAGESYDYKNYVGSKELVDAESGRIFIRSVATVNEEVEGDTAIAYEYTCRVSGYQKATRPVTYD